MSKESYARGFCKAASAHGVDPYALVALMQKSAQYIRPPTTQAKTPVSQTVQSPVAKPKTGWFSDLASRFKRNWNWDTFIKTLYDVSERP